MSYRINLDSLLTDARRTKPHGAPYVFSECGTSARRIALLQSVAKEFHVGIKVLKRVIKSHKGFYGLAYMKCEQIWLYEREVPSNDWFLSCLYHEIGHILCTRAQRYPTFHNYEVSKKDFKKVALRAERYVDAIACEFLRRRHPNATFKPSYEEPDDVELLRGYIDREVMPDKNEDVIIDKELNRVLVPVDDWKETEWRIAGKRGKLIFLG